jgi:serine O-acetyltransferase
VSEEGRAAQARALIQSYEKCDPAMCLMSPTPLPRPEVVVECFESIRALLFPGYAGPFVQAEGDVVARLEALARRMTEETAAALRRRGEDAAEAGPRVERVLASLPALRSVLAADVAASYDGDPAATGTDEVLLCYPGFYALTAYRVAHRLVEESIPILPRMITEHAHRLTGIDIHPGARIGRSFFMDHGTGTVIGETCVIGDRVRVYQGVTLGALSLPRGKAHNDGRKRHPTLEDDVIIYANATILGGDTVIGKGAVIGGNCWVTRSVAPGARMTVDGTTTIGPL